MRIDFEIEKQIDEWRSNNDKEPQYVVIGIQKYYALCVMVRNLSNESLGWLAEYKGLKIIVVRADILEVVAEPGDMVQRCYDNY